MINFLPVASFRTNLPLAPSPFPIKSRLPPGCIGPLEISTLSPLDEGFLVRKPPVPGEDLLKMPRRFLIFFLKISMDFLVFLKNLQTSNMIF